MLPVEAWPAAPVDPELSLGRNRIAGISVGAMMRTMRLAIVLAVLAASLVGCVGATGSLGPNSSQPPVGSGVASPAASIVVPGQSSDPSAPPPSIGPLEVVELRYRLVDGLGRPLFCDPDFYPVARSDETRLAAERFPAIRADAAAYSAITAHLQIDPVSPTPDQILAIYREWKMLRALVLAPLSGGFNFDFIAAAGPAAQDGWHVIGTIAADGTINLQSKDPSGPPPCPICLARGTRISTPSGDMAVEDIALGMAVWTFDRTGGRIIGRVVAVGSSPVPSTHRVVHLVLDDGRTLDVSPGHPLPDGRRLGDLRPGDVVDGARVVSADPVPYAGGPTFDLLASGSTGTYWANGILLASTLAPSASLSR